MPTTHLAAADSSSVSEPARSARALGEAVMRDVYLRGDRWMGRLVVAHLAFAFVLAPFHDTWIAAATIGGGLAALFLLLARLRPGHLATRVVAGIVLQGFCGLHIFQMAGMAEMHFFFFTAVTALIIYQDVRAFWPGVILIIVQHVVFHSLHNLGIHPGGLRFFEQTEVTHLRMVMHYGIAIFQVAVASHWATTLRAQTLREARQRGALEVGVETLRDEATALEEANHRLNETERELRLANREVAEREERFRQLAENIPQVFWIADLDAARFTYVSPAYEQIWGQSVESLYQDAYSVLSVVLPEDEGRVRPLVAAILAGESGEGQFRIALPDGSVRWLHVRAFPITDPDGTVRRIAGITEDVTERRQASDALRTNEQRLRLLLAQLPALLWTADRELRFTHCQGRGLELSDSVGSPCFCAVPPRWFAPDAAGGVARQAHERALAGESVSYTLSWEGRVYDTHVAPLLDDAGEITGVCGLAFDVTEQRSLEDQLRQSQKMEAVGLLAGGIAHDFNNMLLAIRGHADFVAEWLPPMSPVWEDVQEIKRSADRSADLTRQLLAFSRKQVLQPRRVDLNDVVRSMGAMLRRLIGADIELVSELPADLPPAHADPGQVEQVILNLAVNARDAMPAGGLLLVSTRSVTLSEEAAAVHPGAEAGPYVVVSVADTGCGMDEEVRARVFEPFFTTKEQGKGTGLGLSTVYGIAQQSGGFVTLSTAPGRGATFSVHFRQAGAAIPDEATEAPASGEAPAPTAAGQTILVVEDEPAVRSLVQRVLRRAGYTVLVADGGAAAAEILDRLSEPIDLLLSDMVMPRESGPEVAAWVRKACPDVGVLFMSGYAEDGAAQRAIAGDACAFLGKPFTPDELLAAVRNTLASRQLTSAS